MELMRSDSVIPILETAALGMISKSDMNGRIHLISGRNMVCLVARQEHTVTDGTEEALRREDMDANIFQI